MNPILYTYAEAAERLRIKPDTLQRWVAAGRVPHYKYFNKRVYFTDDHLAAIFQEAERGAFTAPKRRRRAI